MRWLGMSVARNTGHAGKADHDAPVIGQRSPGEPSARAAADERVCDAGRRRCIDRLHLGRGARQNHRRRQAAQHGQAIALVGLQLVALDDQAVGAHGIA